MPLMVVSQENLIAILKENLQMTKFDPPWACLSENLALADNFAHYDPGGAVVSKSLFWPVEEFC
jgi:hypothetical protein